MSAMGAKKRNSKYACHIPGLEDRKLGMAGTGTLESSFETAEIEVLMS